MVKPVIALIGRPNVGKSTLFNWLTHSRQALVADQAGLTRDRQYGRALIEEVPMILVDSGGLGQSSEAVEALVSKQTQQAIDEADLILFVVDGVQGLTGYDQDIAKLLRGAGKPVLVVVNKAENDDTRQMVSEFYSLGLGEPVAVSAAHKVNQEELATAIIATLPDKPKETESDRIPEMENAVKVAIVGRPNVGKSTMINRLLGEERVVVMDQPGTTRDSIYIPLERNGKFYTLIDTAGVRKRARVEEKIEKFSVVKTLQAIEDADVVVLLIDAEENITDQDLHLLGFIIEAGKSLVIGVNKWDSIDFDHRQMIRKELHRRLQFVDYAEIYFVSAQEGTNTGHLLSASEKAYRSAHRPVATPVLNKILAKALQQHQPPLVRGRRIKLRYAHLGGHNPFTIVLHGSQTKSLSSSYQRYLASYFQRALKLIGTPVHFEMKEGDNPYKDKKNTLSPGQYRKRQRLIRHSRN